MGERFSYDNSWWNLRIKKSYKDPTCFQNPDNATYTNLILTNKPLSFKRTYVIESELSDFYKMTVAVIKMDFLKWNHRLLVIGNIRNFMTKLS